MFPDAGQLRSWVQVKAVDAAFLCADLGLTCTPRPDHASHLVSWLQVLRDDKRAIFNAACQAARASALHPDCRNHSVAECACN